MIGWKLNGSGTKELAAIFAGKAEIAYNSHVITSNSWRQALREVATQAVNISPVIS